MLQKCYPRPLLFLIAVYSAFATAATAQEGAAPVFEDAYGERLFDQPLPQVLSATRLRQAKADAPATVTVLRGEMLQSLGISTLWDAFRLVPGMTLGYVESNVPVVSYHGTVANDQRRLQVLLDGRSMYNPNLADVDWHTLPVALEDIDRIEINRGPNAAAYGVNAFLATINIITKTPEDTHGSYGRVIRGYNDRERYFAAHGQRIGKVDWRLSYLKRIDDGFDKRCKSSIKCDRPERLTEVPDDGYNIDTVNLRSVLQASETGALTFNAGYSSSLEEVDPEQYGTEFGFQDRPDIDGEDYYGQFKWQQSLSATHRYHLQAYYNDRDRVQEWRSCPDLEVIDFLPFAFCADANQNISENRLDIEFQDTLSLGSRARLVSGLSYRRDRFESDTYFNGKGENQLYRVFSNLELRPSDWTTVNLGAMWEDDDKAGNFLSPRAALNLHLDRQQTLRFIFSKAYRTPDTFEQSADYAYRARNVDGTDPPALAALLEGQRLEAGAQGIADLREEKILSREISYYGLFPVLDGQLSLEAKVFRDSLKDLITGIFGYEKWDVDNYVSSNQTGFELETSMSWPRDMLRLSYAYLDQDDRFIGDPERTSRPPSRYFQLENRLTARHSGSIAWIRKLPHNMSLGSAYYFANRLSEQDYQELELRLEKSFVMPRYSVSLAGTLRQAMNNDPVLFYDNQYSDKTRFYGEASVRF